MQETGHTEPLQDQELIHRYRESGNREPVGLLFRRYVRFVFLVCMKYLRDEEKARDAAMQIFENLLSDLKRHDIQNFKPWLYKVTRNHCLEQLRDEKRIHRLSDEYQKEHSEDMESGVILHHQEDAEQRLKDLEGAILLLNKEQRICIELFYLRKLSYHEIVQQTGSTFQQVKSHIQNGKRNLRILMSKRNE